jgi:poly(3-hydroxybutyrate) depolymerase
LALAVSALATSPSAQAVVVALPSFNVDTSQTTVSGMSSGGYMASQLGYAFSATFKGVGVFTGGPYSCGGHYYSSNCMSNAVVSATMINTMQADINNWSSTTIDDKVNVAKQKVFLWVGNSDTTVGPNEMNAVNTLYQNNGVTTANLDYIKRDNTAHVMPTDFDSTGNNACNNSASPYISNCGYDGAKAMLSFFYGTLTARNDAPAAGNYIEFDQTPYIASNPGMAATGWIYVPASCAAGTQCKLHVALHGCQQNYATIGDKFVKNTGYTRWADTNNIIVMFPQTKVDNTSHATSASGSLANANGCWDWIGWYGTNFAQKAGTQMSAIKAMVDRVSSGTGSGGGGGGGALPAPTGVATSGATNTSMVISWGAVSGASGYNVYRGGAKVNASAVTGTSYTDTGLAAATTYSWTVTSLNASGVESAQSTAASGTTTGTQATCFTASNYAHTTAGRAYQSGGYTYANGSNQNMGLWNTFVTTTLKQTGTNYYVIGTCP